MADPCRVGDPNRKGTVENAVQHTQGTALKGRKYEAIETQDAWLARWEEKWAAPRIHGRKKRQVLEMFHEEQPHLRPLPLEAFRYYKPGVRMVDDAGLVQVDGSYYAALPAPLHSEVQVRIYEQEIEIYGAGGQLLRRHRKSERKGQYVLAEEDRLFNPSRETGRLLAAECASYAAVRRALERQAEARPATAPLLIQEGPVIRAIAEYQTFWEAHSCTNATKEIADADDHG